MAKQKSRSRASQRKTETLSTNEMSLKRGDLTTEYRYVIEDLKRIGIIAAVLIAGLIALSFFL